MTVTRTEGSVGGGTTGGTTGGTSGGTSGGTGEQPATAETILEESNSFTPTAGEITELLTEIGQAQGAIDSAVAAAGKAGIERNVKMVNLELS